MIKFIIVGIKLRCRVKDYNIYKVENLGGEDNIFL
jgi:hypothetical protein